MHGLPLLHNCTVQVWPTAAARFQTGLGWSQLLLPVHIHNSHNMSRHGLQLLPADKQDLGWRGMLLLLVYRALEAEQT